MQGQETEQDIYASKKRFHAQLCDSAFALWQDYHAAGKEEQAGKWRRRFERLSDCQTQWLAYRANCCNARPIAVPVGCNQRLCPLCAWHRSEVSRKRVKSLFDRLHHPAMITLTTPNLPSLRKHDFTLMRQRVRSFIAQNKGWITGGVYSLETTYNHDSKTWHLHVHVLADLSASLPQPRDKVSFNGGTMGAFKLLKRKLEFEWLRLTQGKAQTWGRRARGNASPRAIKQDRFSFERWMEGCEANQLRVFTFGPHLGPLTHGVKITRRGYWSELNLSAAERDKRTRWNCENRRVFDIRPVSDREGAAFEVLKYITKVAEFSNLPFAVAEFWDATRGARLIQTFGSWYGFNPEAGESEAEKKSTMQCDCGCNVWERYGVVTWAAVEYCADDGTFRVRPQWLARAGPS